MKDYETFLNRKNEIMMSAGIEGDLTLNPKLYDFQRDIVRWALFKGRAAIFADCGLGKTIMQLEWAHQVHLYCGGDVLILAPLSVTEQTKREGQAFGIAVQVCESQADVVPGINITNYEKLAKFDATHFKGVVLDESSILKSFTGKVRTAIIDAFRGCRYRLACTATPAPNDYMELGNHAEFLDVMSRNEMLATFFVHDSGNTSKWRLKRHAEDIFWQWMAGWSVFMDNPKSLGYEVTGYDLPPLNIHEIIVDGDIAIDEALTLTERRKARKDTLDLRCQAAADLINASDDQWLVWCDLNAESQGLYDRIEDSFQVRGSDKAQYKMDIMSEFSDDLVKCLITKPSIAGFGMNWQQCHKMVFVGLSDSYEKYYQAMRRCWRFGQDQPVDVYIIISAREGAVKSNIERKETDAKKMQEATIEYTKEITKNNLKQTARMVTPYEPEVMMSLPDWEEFYESA
ncbi:Helicase conserved C-terminal domain-containing protein [Eubacterium aggregans]|uniref:Helicase conserved C-terminal domain-containing protein n=1 Tax=Eubacterium aggregans TaxID=81409 RepID=A0A1H3Y1B8_9FIRM|nr:SNF2-related protein [Eubacterium aggregans]SEA05373.1 Helicase conserved C-terminal domain-containing protein [Eubacterium aggregans]